MKKLILVLIVIVSVPAFAAEAFTNTNFHHNGSEERETLKEIGDHPSVSYRYKDRILSRLRAIESLNSNNLSREQIVSLQIIAVKDPDWRVREEAQTALEGGQTRSMIRAKDKEALKEIGDHPSVFYMYSDRWFDRLKAIQSLNSNQLNFEQVASLKIIALKDPDLRIRGEAQTALEGDQTRSMIRAEGDEVLKKIGDHPSIFYKYDEPWYSRLQAIESLDSNQLSSEQAFSLKIIAIKDPDWRIRAEAKTKLKE